MSQMPIAESALYFTAQHSEGEIAFLFDVLGGDDLPEARPASARFEFCLGIKQSRIAVGAAKHPCATLVKKFATPRYLSPGLAGNCELWRSQNLPPFVLSLVDRMPPHFPRAFAMVVELHNLDGSIRIEWRFLRDQAGTCDAVYAGKHSRCGQSRSSQ